MTDFVHIVCMEYNYNLPKLIVGIRYNYKVARLIQSVPSVCLLYQSVGYLVDVIGRCLDFVIGIGLLLFYGGKVTGKVIAHHGVQL